MWSVVVKRVKKIRTFFVSSIEACNDSSSITSRAVFAMDKVVPISEIVLPKLKNKKEFDSVQKRTFKQFKDMQARYACVLSSFCGIGSFEIKIKRPENKPRMAPPTLDKKTVRSGFSVADIWIKMPKEIFLCGKV